jgi:RimJ/RimL family protein N-acetyltransferase
MRVSTVAGVTLAARTGPLAGRHVELVPLAAELVDELVAAADVDRATYSFTEVPATRDEMATYVSWLLGHAEHDQAVPFAQRLTGSGRIVGCTRFMELRWWRGRTVPDEVEIGGTWLAADVQRTATNTEAKLLLLTHAFEAWSVDRVALATDERNARSRAAITRLGATFEGILRKHRPSKAPGEIGTARNTALFSITADEWPAVRGALAERLDSHG